VESGGESIGTRRRRRRRRRADQGSLRHWAKDDEPEGDPRDEQNLGLVVALAVGLVLILLVAYVIGQMEYEAPF
jgi:hypothetical protein